MKKVVMLVLLAVFALVGCSSTTDDDLEKEQRDAQDLKNIQTVLTPFMKQQTAQYNDMSAKYDSLQKENTQLQASLTEAQKTSSGYRSELAGMKADNKNFSAEIVALRTSLQNAVNEKSNLSLKVSQSQLTVAELQQFINDSNNEYDKLISLLNSVDDRTNIVVNNFTEEERVIFYEVWDKWWLEDVE